jgi:hypothetical protein
MTQAQALLDRALVEEATKKSGLIWVQGATAPAPRALWHVWHDGAVCVVGDGPSEQPFTDLDLTDGGTATVTVRSKDKGGRLVSWQAHVRELPPDGAAWQAAAAALKDKRLNTPDAEEVLERWVRECRLLRLEPADGSTKLPDGSLAAAPLPTPATTRRPVPAALPRLLLRRRGGRSGGGDRRTG